MAKKRNKKKQKEEKVDLVIDYEPTLPTRDPDKVRSDENVNEIEVIIENPDPDEIRKELGEYSTDPDVIDDFVDRQNLNTGGNTLLDKLEEYNMQSPVDSAGDVDADWDYTNGSGEEALGGDSPTPDQDVVDDIGAAAGITYGVEEPLNSDKIRDRDRNRWEMNPASADEQDLPTEEGDEEDCEEDEEEAKS